MKTKSIYRVTPLGFESEYVVVEDVYVTHAAGTGETPAKVNVASIEKTTAKVINWVRNTWEGAGTFSHASGLRVERVSSVGAEID